MNLVPELPYVTATGVNYDSGDFLHPSDAEELLARPSTP